MSPVVTEAELADDLFDLDLKITLDPADPPDNTARMAHTSICETVTVCPTPTAASSCNSYGQTGHPCRCF